MSSSIPQPLFIQAICPLIILRLSGCYFSTYTLPLFHFGHYSFLANFYLLLLFCFCQLYISRGFFGKFCFRVRLAPFQPSRPSLSRGGGSRRFCIGIGVRGCFETKDPLFWGFVSLNGDG